LGKVREQRGEGMEQEPVELRYPDQAEWGKVQQQRP
jgi:hypothetical protein